MRNLKVILFLALAARISTTQKYAPGANYPYLATLCQLYLSASNPPLPDTPRSSPDKTVPPPETLMAALADEEWVEAVKTAKSEKDLHEPLQKKYEAHMRDWALWKEAVDSMPQWPEIMKHKGEIPAVKAAQMKLAKIVKRIETIKAKETTFGQDPRRLGVIRKLVKAATGLDEDSLKATEGKIISITAARNTACGANGPAAGRDAGKAIVVDMLCLCAAQANTGASTKDFCGEKIGIVGSASSEGTEKWNSGAPAASLLETITRACTQKTTPPPANARELRGLLAKFMQSVKKGAHCAGVGGTDGATFSNALGHWYSGSCGSTGSVNCGGDSSSSGGACIYYERNQDAEPTITWFNEMHEALTTIEQLENESEQIRHELALRDMLHTRAEEIYEEVKAASEIDRTATRSPANRLNSSENPTTQSDKVTTKGPAAASAPAISRIILPWTLLI